MINTKIRLITFFAAKDGEALYSQQKQDLELTVAQIISPYCKIQAQTEEIREIGLLLGFPGGPMVKNPAAMQETWV